MRITLLRFKCYVEATTKEFEMGQLTLIDGASGIGKTTLLEAVLWCLYGGINHIYPSGKASTSSSPTCVVLELPELRDTNNPEGISIRRVQPPSTLEVKVNDTILTGVAATAYVESIFGPKDFFFTSSYIQQNNRCPLITGSNAEKTQLLTELTFGNSVGSEMENPEFYLTRISAELDKVKTHITMEIGKCNLLNQNFTTYYNQNKEMFDMWNNRPSSFTPELLQSAISENSSQIEALLEKSTQLNTLRTQYQVFEKQLSDLKVIEEPIDPNIDDELRICEQNLYQAREVASKIKEYESLKSSLQEFDKELAFTSEEELSSLKEKYSRIVKEEEKALRLGFKLNEKDVFTRTLLERIATEGKLCIGYEEFLSFKELLEEFNKTSSKINKELFEEEQAIIQAQYEEKLQKYQEEEIIRNNLLREYQESQHKYQQYRSKLLAYEKSERELFEANRKYESCESEIELEWFRSKYNEKIDINTMEEVVRNLRQLQQQLYCPHCSGSLIYNNGNLSIGTVSKEEAEEKIKDVDRIRLLINKYKKYEESKKERDSKQTHHDLLEKPSLVEEPIAPIIEASIRPKLVLPTSKTALLHSIPKQPSKSGNIEHLEKELEIALTLSVEDSVPSKTRISLLEKQKLLIPLYNRFSELGPLPELIETVEELTLKKTKLQALKDQYMKNLNLFSSHIKVKFDLEEKIKSLHYDEEELLKCTKEISLLKEKETELNRWKQTEAVYNQAKFLHSQTETQNSVVIGYSQYENLLVKFKTIVQELASQAMENTIDSINTICNDILHEIFDSGIQVLLKTHKELKTKDTTKLQVNLQVQYRGNIYDSPLRLSGGEQDRISMALTLAVARVSSSPLIMLDECMAALDEDLREQCLETIEKFFPGKTILHICHGAVRGQHSRVLHLSS